MDYKHYSPFQDLTPYAIKLERNCRFYGVRMGHYNNKRQIGYIEVDFHFKDDRQANAALREIELAIGKDHPFVVLEMNDYDPEFRVTYSTVRLLMTDNLELDSEELHEWERRQQQFIAAGESALDFLGGRR